MKRTPVISTSRLRLCPFRQGDLRLLVSLHGDPLVQRFLTFENEVWDEAVLRDKLDLYRRDYSRYGWSKFAVFDLDGDFVGRAGFGRFEDTGESELGFSFKRAVWGRGYASEADLALVEWIYAASSVDHVIAFAAEDNVASRAVLVKLGMISEGTRKLGDTSFAFYRHDRPH
ncbi:GNAT family N-acetyltransferase [Aquamicrobium sp. LC103]|uniref:GNAT family N-acetyltransferase n=1 Tax=Aquamicrobium sp. LC103 TaxID=1120658 RepID=UPI000A7C7EDE|nr:GNAT family N-acetyltransferase [Aquamicrobium sp. LC103]